MALGLLLVAAAVTFQAVELAPELRIGRIPVNDAAFHIAASERLGKSFAQREPFLDPWVSEWSLGYPVWRSYQPLPHLLAAGFLAILHPLLSHAATFAALQYLLLLLLPVSAYASSRLLGLGPPGAGLAALLVLAPAGAGEFGRYGLQYGAFVWRGSGLYTQLVAVHFFLLALGSARRALDSGRGRAVAGALFAATALSHIVFGYAIAASAALLALTGPRGQRGRRLVRLAAIGAYAIPLTAWFVVPLFLTRVEINHSRWEAAYKWDSFGASSVLRELGSGRLLDAGRLPALSLFLLAGLLVAAVRLRDPLARRLLILSLAWLALFFGRATWGKLIAFAGVPSDMPMHRFQAIFECFLVLLTAWGLETALQFAWSRRSLWTITFAVVVAGLAAIAIERAAYLSENARWGQRNLEAVDRELPDLQAALAQVRQIVSERPGRVAAGKAADWGNTFKVGDEPVFAFLTLEHFDQVSFLYHAMSRTSDVMVLRDELNPAHGAIFGVRSVIAPATWQAPGFLRPRGVFGRFAVFESSPDGYFSLVDVGARSSVSREGEHDVDARWLQSPWSAAGLVAAFDSIDPRLPDFPLDKPAPAVPAQDLSTRGEIIGEGRGDSGRYRARVRAARACDVMFKMTWDPLMAATVDGHPARMQRVTPGFGAVVLPPGLHEIEVRYRPGPLRPVLFFTGILAFLAASRRERSLDWRPAEEKADVLVSGRVLRLPSPSGPRRIEIAAASIVVLAAAATVWFGRTGAGGRSSAAGTSGPAGTQAPMEEGLHALYDLHDPGAAVRGFEQVLRLQPGHYGATFQLARALDEMGRPDEARRIWVKMLSMAESARDSDTLMIIRERLAHPDLPNADSLMRAGLDALYSRRDPESAARAFREVLRLNPEHYGATYQLAAALDQLGRPGEALPLWRTMLVMAERSGDPGTAATARSRIAASQR
jgi:Tfp pilus assembly protein PilF